MSSITYGYPQWGVQYSWPMCTVWVYLTESVNMLHWGKVTRWYLGGKPNVSRLSEMAYTPSPPIWVFLRELPANRGWGLGDCRPLRLGWKRWWKSGCGSLLCSEVNSPNPDYLPHRLLHNWHRSFVAFRLLWALIPQKYGPQWRSDQLI